MVAKRVSPKKTTRRKATASAADDMTKSATIPAPEAVQAAAGAAPVMDAEVRRRLVAAEAYYLAERRGFAQGHEHDDWAAAEAVVDSRLQNMPIA
ncbi:MAG: DUF2934 domain-containing protein [Pseudomonadota bacterium]|nr:DUF2934 domain-containing protein [Pseudomonadota bacterium]